MAQTINKLSPVTPQLSDLIAIWQTADSDTRNTSLSRLLTLFEDNLSVGKPTTQYDAPNATAFTTTLLDTGVDVHLILTPTGTFATGTIVLPTAVVDKQEVIVNSTQEVTALTISSTKTVNGGPTTLAANGFFTLKYDATFDAWYRIA